MSNFINNANIIADGIMIIDVVVDGYVYFCGDISPLGSALL
jgi:hypothetical protein